MRHQSGRDEVHNILGLGRDTQGLRRDADARGHRIDQGRQRHAREHRYGAREKPGRRYSPMPPLGSRGDVRADGAPAEARARLHRRGRRPHTRQPPAPHPGRRVLQGQADILLARQLPVRLQEPRQRDVHREGGI